MSKMPPNSSSFIDPDDLVKILWEGHLGESHGPKHLEITGFRRLPRTRSGVRRNDEFYEIATI
jgi:hypothetical protein